MKILIHSKHGESYGIATHLSSEDNEVGIFILDPKYKERGIGIQSPARLTDCNSFLKNTNLIMFDEVGMGNRAFILRKKGIPLLGASSEVDLLESDREQGIKIAKRYTKLRTPDYKSFTKTDDGIKFLSSQKEQVYCFKPHNMPTNWTFVPRLSYGNEATISVMKSFPKKNHPYILQQKVEGITISTEGWWNGKYWDTYFNHTIENKRFLEGDKGPNCGCAGSVVWKTRGNKLTRDVLEGIGDFLKKTSYIGPVDINCIVDDSSAWFLEFTPRFGYDAIQNLLTLTKSKTDFFYNIATGSDNHNNYKNDKYSLSVRLSMSPYPYSEDHKDPCRDSKGLKVVNISSDKKANWWPWDVMMKDSEVVLAGTDNIVGVVCCSGNTIQECRQLVYKTIDNITMTNDLQYRSDIGLSAINDIKKLEGQGWL